MEVLDLYLAPDGVPEGDGLHRWSTLTAGLRDARNVTGRDPHTGEVVRPNSVVTWVGAMAYLAVAEQIGRAVRRTDLRGTRQARIAALPDKRASTPFLRSFIQFTTLNDKHIAALYGLRCAFVHSFGLVNKNSGQPQYQHRFILGAGSTSLVRLPRKAWDGRFTMKRTTRSGNPVGTYVDVHLLGDRVEGMASLLSQLRAAGRLQVAVSDHEEFRQRFSMKY